MTGADEQNGREYVCTAFNPFTLTSSGGSRHKLVVRGGEWTSYILGVKQLYISNETQWHTNRVGYIT